MVLSDGDVARACNHHLETIADLEYEGTARAIHFGRRQGDNSIIETRLPGRRVENDPVRPRIELDFQAVGTAPKTMDGNRAQRRFLFGIVIVTDLAVGQWQAQDSHQGRVGGAW